MVKLGAYAVMSTIGALVVISHAFITRGQLYPAARYLATSKISLFLLLNMALVVICGVWQLIKAIFLGRLREAEVERLNEQLWRELMEILFAVTIFRQEFNVTFVAMVTMLLSIKAFHWLLQKRVEYMETTPAVSRLSHARIVLFMILLFSVDTFFFLRSFSYLVSTKASSVALFFAFEYVILATSTVATFLKYAFYICDIVLEGQWESKAVFTFYLELVRDLLHLSLYLIFFCVIFINYGLPLHLVRELYETFLNFRARVSDFIRYRKVTSNMQDRFPDATAEELSRSDATCIICREEMSSAKKLQCGHLFHVHCLRSWLERQQTCPTCRSPVLPTDNNAAASHPHFAERRPELQGANRQGPGTSVEATNGSSFGNRQAAAAAAASQYMASIAYPVFQAPTNGGHTPCMMYVPQAWVPNMPPQRVEASTAGHPFQFSYPRGLNNLTTLHWQQNQLQQAIEMLQKQLERNAALQTLLNTTANEEISVTATNSLTVDSKGKSSVDYNASLQSKGGATEGEASSSSSSSSSKG